jgi:hypothetical protein
MVLPSSLLEEEDELLSVGTLRDQPLIRTPVPPYIVVARVTTVIRSQETRATLQIGAGDDGRDP